VLSVVTEVEVGDGRVFVRAIGLSFAYTDVRVFNSLNFSIKPGLTWIRGGAGRGKTALLNVIAGTHQPQSGTLQREQTPYFRTDLLAPDIDHDSGRDWLKACRAVIAPWDCALESDLIDAFGLAEHIAKPIYMLSKGSWRKVGLVAAFACGASVALLDTPFAALDAPSSRLLTELLEDAAQHQSRAWVVADFELPVGLEPWARETIIELGD
jgi:ABC-type multidrug transport system ATPase subunit